MEPATHLYLKPKNSGACIRDPRSRMALPEFGARVPNNTYWRARFRDGDCLATTSQEVATAKARIAKKVAANELNEIAADKTKQAKTAKKEG